MIRNDITPLSDLTRRPPEAGRIRLGEKTGSAMRSLDKFRFTSPDQTVISQLAALYGGECKPWNDPKANPSKQWQVHTEAAEIPVYLVPDGLSVWYETWAHGGVQRRCDGVMCEVPRVVGYDYEMVQQNCLCRVEGVRSCRPYTRMQLILPQVSFRGVWRLETKGWNAATELPGMYDMIVQLAERGGLLQAMLGIERREQRTAAGKRNFVVPRLTIVQTAEELQAGGASAGAITAGGSPAVAALPAAPVVEEIVDAEIVDPAMLEVESRLRDDAANFGLDAEQYVAAVRRQADGDVSRMSACSARVRADELIPIGFTATGFVQWHKP